MNSSNRFVRACVLVGALTSTIFLGAVAGAQTATPPPPTGSGAAAGSQSGFAPLQTGKIPPFQGPPPGVKPPWYTLEYTFNMERGKAALPRAPIQDKAKSMEMRPEFLAASTRSPALAK